MEGRGSMEKREEMKYRSQEERLGSLCLEGGVKVMQQTIK
jgi:hypothetical protein